MSFESVKIAAFIFVGLFGLAVGSFLNVCIFRLPRACMSVFKPLRSFCPNCFKPIRWFDNIPIASFFLLKGKCRYCKKPISIRYLVVELLTGLVFLYLFWHFFYFRPYTSDLERFLLFLLHAYFFCCIIIIFFVDFDFRIIPDEASLPAIVIGLLFSALLPYQIHGQGLIGKDMQFNPSICGLITAGFGAFIGAVLLLAVRILGGFIFRKEAMGLGDVKYLAMLGSLTGWQGVLYILFIGCIIGAVFGIIYYIITKDRYIPFGPFLSISACFVILFARDIEKFRIEYLNPLFNLQIL